jgi:thymidine phosphorylase
LRELVLALCEALCATAGNGIEREALEDALDGGAARELFARWAAAQGADPGWIDDWSSTTAPHAVTIEAPRAGVVARIETRQLGLILAEAGAGRHNPGEPIDLEIALEMTVRLGEAVEAGAPLCRLHLRGENAALERQAQECFEIAESGEAPALIQGTILPD